MPKLDKNIGEFFSKFPSKKYPKGAVLLNPEELPPGVIYLKDGYVRQFTISDEGVELTLHIYSPNAHFPMFWALNGSENKHYFQAVTAIEIAISPKEKFIQFLKLHPDSLFSFTRRVISGLEGLSRRIEITSFGSAYQRVVSMLLFLARHFGEKSQEKITLTSKFTHHEIAGLAGLSRERTSIEMEKLIKKGLIKYNNHKIIIADLKKLSSEVKN
ncbi:Crp/Fnr family transcriptional regulator [Candidatus Daviesbacteria bacterium]|nr:Crp/Fnr family transcriptional regulator [Candidatus Daviesbacteria bacterium]